MSKTLQEIVTYVESLPAARGSGDMVGRAVQVNAEAIRVLLGEEVPEETPRKPKVTGPDYWVRNRTNRPYSVSLAKTEARAILDGQWELTGETFIISRSGQVLDGQHRGGGLLWADHWWNAAKEEGTLDQLYPTWSSRRPFIDVWLVAGISDASNVVNKINTGKVRSISDVIFRDYKFDDAYQNTKDRKSLAKLAAPTIRLVWGRMGGKLIKNTPKLDQRAAENILSEHVALMQMVERIYGMDRDENDPKAVSNLCPPSVVAGMAYLMATAKTKPLHEQNGEVKKIKVDLWEDALDFWREVVKGSDLPEGHPALILGKYLRGVKKRASGAGERDQRVGVIVNCWNAWIEGKRKDLTLSDLKPRKDDDPRIGGLDTVLVSEAA